MLQKISAKQRSLLIGQCNAGVLGRDGRVSLRENHETPWVGHPGQQRTLALLSWLEVFGLRNVSII
jgi:hypothetical protein